MMVENKHAVINSASGCGACLRSRGRQVSLAWRTPKLDDFARAISAASRNVADVAQVAALDQQGIACRRPACAAP